MQVFGSMSSQKTLRNCSPLEELFRLEKENTLPCQDMGISIKAAAVDELGSYSKST